MRSIRRIAAFVLLAVPFLALACTDAEQATLLEPPAVSADVTTLAAPVDGTFVIRVFYPNASPVGPCLSGTEVFSANIGGIDTYTLPTDQSNACVVVELTSHNPTKNGAMSGYGCRGAGGSFNASSAECETGDGRWEIFSRNTLGMTQWRFAGGSFGVGTTRGSRYDYKGRGSGVKNQTVGTIDITRAVP